MTSKLKGNVGKGNATQKLHIIELLMIDRKCAECDKIFESQQELFKHVLQYHSNNKAFKCRDCSLLLTNMKCLSHHMETHTDSPKKYGCQLCSKDFFSNDEYKRHLKSHNKVKSMNEDSDNDLLTKKHVCKYCSKNFDRIFNLHRHLRVHTGERPYSCSLCDKSYKEKCDLENHQKFHIREQKGLKGRTRISSGKRPHECSLCDKAYKEKRHLIRHQKVHLEQNSKKSITKSNERKLSSGERPYLCSLCGQDYKEKRYLIKHQKIHLEQKTEKSTEHLILTKINEGKEPTPAQTGGLSNSYNLRGNRYLIKQQKTEKNDEHLTVTLNKRKKSSLLHTEECSYKEKSDLKNHKKLHLMEQKSKRVLKGKLKIRNRERHLIGENNTNVQSYDTQSFSEKFETKNESKNAIECQKISDYPEEHCQYDQKPLKCIADEIKNIHVIKEDFYSETESLHDLEVKNIVEFSKTEYIHDEALVKSVKRFEDSSQNMNANHFDEHYQNDQKPLKYVADKIINNHGFKEKPYSDSESQDNIENKSFIEIFKTEYIYDESIINTAVRLKDKTETH